MLSDHLVDRQFLTWHLLDRIYTHFRVVRDSGRDKPLLFHTSNLKTLFLSRHERSFSFNKSYNDLQYRAVGEM